VLVNFAYRRQGALIRKEMSKDIRGIKDLAGKKKKLVNRQKGSGTRVLLDELF
jgi:putative molybdopterin biosynthesis protein